MSQINFIIVGNESSKKHFLASLMYGDSQFNESSTFSIQIEEEKAECSVHFVHDTIPFSQRKFIYLQGDIVILVYSATDKNGENDVVKNWIPELHSLSTRLPTILVLTNIDEVEESQREAIIEKGNNIKEDSGCLSFYSIATGNKNSNNDESNSNTVALEETKRLFNEAIIICLRKKRQKHMLVKKPTHKRNRFSLTRRKKNDSQSTFASNSETDDDLGTGFSYKWKGESIGYLMEQLCGGGSSLRFKNDSVRDMTEKLLIEDVVEASIELVQKFLLYYHFQQVCKSNGEMDNLNFYIEADYFMNSADMKSKSGGKQYKKDANRIIREYIQPDSTKEIYASADVLENVLLKYKVLSQNMFIIAQAQTLSHLSQFFNEKIPNSYLTKELLKSLNEFDPDFFKENIIHTSGDDRIERMLTRVYHGLSLVELLNAKSYERHSTPNFATETDEQKICQNGVKHLLLLIAFIRILGREKSNENILFWLDVEDFRSFDFGAKLPSETVESYNSRVKELWVTRANYLFSTYIRQSAPLLINLPSSLFRSITNDIVRFPKLDLKEINQKGRHMFDAAQKEILNLMKKDSWFRLHSEIASKQSLEKITQLFTSQKLLDPEDLKSQEKFKSRFDLNEPIIRTSRCVFEKKMLIHGELILTTKHLCFYSSIFGFKTSISHEWKEIKKITIAKNTNDKKSSKSQDNEYLIIDIKDSNLVFRELSANIRSIYYLIQKYRQKNISVITKNKKNGLLINQDDDDESRIMTIEDWNSLQAGAVVVKYSKNEIIVTEGNSADFIYQIAVGSCRAEKQTSQGVIVVGRCFADEFIGEISFIERGTVSATVIAETDQVVVYTISRDFVDNLLIENPGLSARFYKFVTTLIVNRIKAKTEISGANKQLLVQKSLSITESSFIQKFRLIDKKSEIRREWNVVLEDRIPIYGQLFLSQTIICFYSQILGSEKKIVIPLKEIKELKIQNEKLLILEGSTNTAVIFQVNDVENVKLSIEEQIIKSDELKLTFEGVNGSELDYNWTPFLEGIELKRYSNKEIIVSKGEKNSYSYQIAQGSVRITEYSNNSEEVRKIGSGDLFGEMTFIESGNSMISAEAGEEGVEIYRVSKSFVDSLLATSPLLAGSFYKYISSFLCKRLRH